MIFQKLYREKKYESYRSHGVMDFKFSLPVDTEQLDLTAEYRDIRSGEAITTARIYSHYSFNRKYIYVYTTTEEISVGEFAIFHVKSNFPMDSFNYLVVAKDVILFSSSYSGLDESFPTITTVDVPVSASMVPSFRMVVYHITREQEVIVDTITVPVTNVSLHKVSLDLSQNKDFTMTTVEAITRSKPGSLFAVSSIRQHSFSMQAGNELSLATVMESLHSFETFNRTTHRVLWRDREGSLPDTSQYFPAPDYGIDANRTFNFSQLVVFTDALVPIVPTFEPEECNITLGLLPCLAFGCYRKHERCDGRNDCPDGLDEAHCADRDEDDARLFRLTRMNRFKDLYDRDGGDWAWLDVNIGWRGEEYTNLEIPLTSEMWVFNGFAVHADLGFAIIQKPIWFSGDRPFYFNLQYASTVRRGEQIAIRVMVYNLMDMEIFVLITLKGSADYKFVEVEPDGVVSHYEPRLSSGDHQHLVALYPKNSHEIYLPVSPTIEQGKINVVVEASSQVAKFTDTASITVLPEGVTVAKHTSMLLDLQNRAIVLRYMDVLTEQTPVVPYHNWRRYIFGSPRATVTLSGDVIGPIFPTIPVSSKSIFGWHTQGAESSAFDVAINVWSLHYLRLTNQLTSDVSQPAFESLTTALAQLHKYYIKQKIGGAYKLFLRSKPSVWATAWSLQALNAGVFYDWENFYYVDPVLVTNCIQWMLQYQNMDGSFNETDNYSNYTHRVENNKHFGLSMNKDRLRDVPLTAAVLISLESSLQQLQGSIKSNATTAKHRAKRYLENRLSLMQDPYDIAITAYVLSLIGSPFKDQAYSQLYQQRREQDGVLYWSRGRVDGLGTKLENNRPFTLPKKEREWDSHAVETTSYALLVFLMREGITLEQEAIVKWLNSMRMVSGGFISHVDTIVGMQALIEFSFRARLREIMQMEVQIDPVSMPGFTKTFQVGNTSIANQKQVQLSDVYGQVNIVARGAGLGVIQLDQAWGIDYEFLKEIPPKNCYDLTVNETYDSFRNKSRITIEACMRWTNTDESPTSGASVLSIEHPSGYDIFQSGGMKIVKSGKFPLLSGMWAESQNSLWFFEYIPANWTCFKYDIRRIHPVANMTQVRGARLFDTFRPERFIQMTYNRTTLYVLNICEVCGSYQCPYCPYYSGGTQVLLQWTAIIVTVCSFFWGRTKHV